MKIYKNDGKILSIVYRNEDWQEGLNFITPDEMFVSSVAMACPFNPTEKQALLEAPSLSARTACLIAILEIAEYDIRAKPTSIHH